MLGYISQRMIAPAETVMPLENTVLYSMPTCLALQHLMFK